MRTKVPRIEKLAVKLLLNDLDMEYTKKQSKLNETDEMIEFLSDAIDKLVTIRHNIALSLEE